MEGQKKNYSGLEKTFSVEYIAFLKNFGFLFPSKRASLSWIQVGLCCFENREKAICFESERILAVCWYLFWAWAFLCNSLLHKDLIYVTLWLLITNHALHLESARNELNFFTPPWRSSFFRWKLWRSFESDRYSYHKLIWNNNRCRWPVAGHCGLQLYCLCFAWDGDMAEEMLSGSRFFKPVPSFGCPARHLSKIHLLHLWEWRSSCLFTLTADCTLSCIVLQVNLTQ